MKQALIHGADQHMREPGRRDTGKCDTCHLTDFPQTFTGD